MYINSKILFRKYFLNIFIIFFFLLLISIQSFYLTNVIINHSFLEGKNSDLLYSFYLLDDLKHNFLNISNWHLTPAPYFFPDIFLVYIINSGDIFSSLYFYSFIIALIYIYLLRKFYLSLGFNQKKSLILSTFSYFFISFLFSFYQGLSYFFFPTYHSSIYIYGLFLFIFRKNNLLSIIIIISFLYGLSDAGTFTQSILPIYLYCLFESGFKNLIQYKNLIMGMSFFFLGNYIQNLLVNYKILIIPDAPIVKTFKFIIKNNLIFPNLIHSYREFLQEAMNYKLYYFFVLLFILICIYQIKFIKNQKIKPIFFSFIIISVFMYFFQGVFGLWIGYRYMWFFYLIPVIFLLYILNEKYEILNQKNIIFFILIFLFIQYYNLKSVLEKNYNIYNDSSKILTSFPDYNSQIHRRWIPDYIHCLFELKYKFQIEYGMTDYWNSKYINYFSRNSIFTNQFTENLEPYLWINNSAYFSNKKYNFIIPSRLNPEAILKNYGIPDIKEKCDSDEIWIYKNYFYYKN